MKGKGIAAISAAAIVLSGCSGSAEVPSLLGFDKATTDDLIDEAGLEPVIIGPNRCENSTGLESDARIINQAPQGGEDVDPGSEVRAIAGCPEGFPVGPGFDP